MKRKLTAGLAATTLATTLFTGLAYADEPTIEWNNQGGQATVDGAIYGVEPVIEVEIPGDLTFGINPLYLDADDDGTAETTQIVSSDYLIINYGNTAVNVDAKTKVSKKGEKVQFKAMAAASFDSNTKELKGDTDKKNIALALLLPTADADVSKDTPELKTTALTRAGDQTDANVKGYVFAESNAGASATTLDVSFLLNAYKNDKLEKENVSGFRFDGFVDPAATFEEGDIELQTVFTLNLVTENEKTNGFETGKSGSVTDLNSTVVKKKE